MSDQRGVLAIISGFSGAGKGTVVKEILSTYEEDYALSISATTRKPRDGEIHGQHYFFVEKTEFEQKIKENQFLEYAVYGGVNYYGTPKDFVFDKLDEGQSVILEIERQGALKVKEQYPETILIFVTPPTVEELENRLRGRGSETEEQIAIRLSTAAEEAAYMNQYDYIVLNESGKIEACAAKIHHIIETEKMRTMYAGKTISNMAEALAKYKKGE